MNSPATAARGTSDEIADLPRFRLDPVPLFDDIPYKTTIGQEPVVCEVA
ncbi:MAG: hypothetical protein ACK4QW_05525 [Alphaproteobacteria bacterium]